MRALLFAAALAAPLSAQVGVEATLLARTVQCGGSAVTAPSPGADVTAGLAVGVSGATSTLQHAATTSDVFVGWNLQCVPPWIGSATADVEVRYVFTAPTPMAATLALAWSTTTTGNGNAQLVVDVHDDGSIDAVGGGVLPVSLGPSPLVVRVRGRVAASGGTTTTWFTTWHWTGTANAQFAMQLLPAHAQVLPITAACSGAAPVLQTTPDFAGGLALSGQFAAADDIAVWAFGFAPVGPLPLPWSNGCVLAVAPDVLVIDAVPASRQWSWSLALPPQVRPLGFDVQLFGVDLAPLQMQAGAAVRVVAP
jgi:hypothetical protein